MKYTYLLLAISCGVSAELDIDKTTGDITNEVCYKGECFRYKTGNILQYKELYGLVGDAAESANALSAAALHAVPKSTGDGLAVGVGLGNSGSANAVAVGLAFDVNEQLSYSAHASGNFKSAPGSQLAIGAGLQFKF